MNSEQGTVNSERGVGNGEQGVVNGERSATLSLGGEQYELILTTRATKEIAQRYGGLAKLGDTLMQAENLEMALSEVIWIIVLLANQSVLIHNLKNPNDKKALVTEEEAELLTTPLDLALYKEAIIESMFKGTKRSMASAEDLTGGEEKNVPAAG